MTYKQTKRIKVHLLFALHLQVYWHDVKSTMNRMTPLTTFVYWVFFFQQLHFQKIHPILNLPGQPFNEMGKRNKKYLSMQYQETEICFCAIISDL